MSILICIRSVCNANYDRDLIKYATDVLARLPLGWTGLEFGLDWNSHCVFSGCPTSSAERGFPWVNLAQKCANVSIFTLVITEINATSNTFEHAALHSGIV